VILWQPQGWDGSNRFVANVAIAIKPGSKDLPSIFNTDPIKIRQSRRDSAQKGLENYYQEFTIIIYSVH